MTGILSSILLVLLTECISTIASSNSTHVNHNCLRVSCNKFYNEQGILRRENFDGAVSEHIITSDPFYNKVCPTQNEAGMYYFQVSMNGELRDDIIPVGAQYVVMFVMFVLLVYFL